MVLLKGAQEIHDLILFLYFCNCKSIHFLNLKIDYYFINQYPFQSLYFILFLSLWIVKRILFVFQKYYNFRLSQYLYYFTHLIQYGFNLIKNLSSFTHFLNCCLQIVKMMFTLIFFQNSFYNSFPLLQINLYLNCFTY